MIAGIIAAAKGDAQASLSEILAGATVLYEFYDGGGYLNQGTLADADLTGGTIADVGDGFPVLNGPSRTINNIQQYDVIPNGLSFTAFSLYRTLATGFTYFICHTSNSVARTFLLGTAWNGGAGAPDHNGGVRLENDTNYGTGGSWVGQSDNEWKLLVMVRDGGSLKLYGNGGLVAENTIPEASPIKNSINKIALHQESDGNYQSSNIWTAAAGVLPVALSAEQVAGLWNHYQPIVDP